MTMVSRMSVVCVLATLVATVFRGAVATAMHQPTGGKVQERGEESHNLADLTFEHLVAKYGGEEMKAQFLGGGVKAIVGEKTESEDALAKSGLSKDAVSFLETGVDAGIVQHITLHYSTVQYSTRTFTYGG
jgi:hypothetical protein